jgi:hypothetical protein
MARSWDITVQSQLSEVSGQAVRSYLEKVAPGEQPSHAEEFDDGELLREAVGHCVREFLAGLGAEGRYSVLIRRKYDETWEAAGDIEAAIREEHPPPSSAPLSSTALEARQVGEELAEGESHAW